MAEQKLLRHPRDFLHFKKNVFFKTGFWKKRILKKPDFEKTGFWKIVEKIYKKVRP